MLYAHHDAGGDDVCAIATNISMLHSSQTGADQSTDAYTVAAPI